ncbi:hypothetical protein BDW74DRAFT_164277 [Aspergillus multicolor]|uniref:uncharacterized protein n=1 Tax=Aspergillus multicolor TaxID=41759 RepID=UPI003CCDF365
MKKVSPMHLPCNQFPSLCCPPPVLGCLEQKVRRRALELPSCLRLFIESRPTLLAP